MVGQMQCRMVALIDVKGPAVSPPWLSHHEVKCMGKKAHSDSVLPGKEL